MLRAFFFALEILVFNGQCDQTPCDPSNDDHSNEIWYSLLEELEGRYPCIELYQTEGYQCRDDTDEFDLFHAASLAALRAASILSTALSICSSSPWA